MISISRSIFTRSALCGHDTNFAANSKEVDLSLHKYTVPYEPLKYNGSISELKKNVIKLCYRPNSSEDIS